MSNLRSIIFGCALMIVPAAIFAAEPPTTRPGTQPATQQARRFLDLDAEAFQKMIAQPNTVILDVRTAEEYAAGHLAGAVLIDVQSPDFAKHISQLDKSKTYLVHCRSGRRSVTACDTLAQAGFPKLYNLLGGINAWQTAGKPVEK